MNNKQTSEISFSTIALLSLLFAVFLFMSAYGCNHYKVYSARMEGEAKLAHAQSEREVQVRDAQGKLEASSLLAKAEVERAKGVAEANKIIGTSLKDNEAYLRWLYIEGLKDKQGEVIYIPTEGGMPILEAGKRK